MYQGKKFLNNLQDYVIKKLSLEGIDTSNFICKHLKLLKAPPNSGPQAPHRDGYDKNHYVVAFYLNNNLTTDVSILPYPQKNIDQMSIEEKRSMDPKYWSELISFPHISRIYDDFFAGCRS